jgi:adenylate kinase
MMLMNQDKIKAIKEWLGTGSINIFGSPFSGKDTQGQRLKEYFNGVLIGGGDILRNSQTSEHLKELMEAGQLAPMNEYLESILPYLSRPDFVDKPLILSAIGRWDGEQEGVVQATEESSHPLKAVLFLILNEDEIWQRWHKSKELDDRGKRADDDENSLKTRLEEYQQKTMPVIDYYRNKGLVIEADGDQTPDEVTNEIIDKLYTFSRA